MQFGGRFIERGIAREGGRHHVTGRNIGVRERDHIVVSGQRRKIVVHATFEQIFFDQRAGRDDTDDVAAHELVRDRRFELFGEGHDAALQHEFCEVPIEGVIRNAGHCDALSATRFFRGQRDRERARDRLGIFAVRFVKITDARE